MYQSGGKKDLNRHMESNQAVKAVKSNYSLEGMLFGSKGSLSEETPTVVMKLSVLLNPVLVLLGLCIRSTYSLSVHSNKNIGNIFYESELLSTVMPICNNRTGLSCPSSDFDWDSRMLLCSFRCPQGKHYQCKEDADHGIIEFCAKPEICDKGQRNSVYFDEEHKSVVIKKDICPEGSFQPFEEDCYIACTQYHHVNKSDLPYYGIAVLYYGNATNAGVGYCDVDRDYVNIDYNMYINLTRHKLSVCVKKENYQIKCATGQRLLPDSRCTTICEEGYVVDKENFFKCSINSSIDTVIDKSSTLVPSISSSTLVPSISGISPSKHITTATQPSTTAQQDGAGVTIRQAIGWGVSALVIIIIICLIVWCVCRRNRKKRGNNTRNSKTGDRNYDGCDFKSFSTKNGDIYVNIEKGSANKSKLMKQPSTDTGFSMHGTESDKESASAKSSESGYNTVQRGQPIPGQDRQTMMEMESVSTGSIQDKNSEETQALKLETEV